MPVRYSLAAIRRSGLVGNGRPIQFVTDADPSTAVEMFRSAARAAEEPYLAAAQDGEDFIASSNYAPAPGGPIGYMHLCDNAELLAAWLASVAERLEQAGLSGELRIVKDVEGPGLDAPTMVAGIALCLDYDALKATPLVDGMAPKRWWVSAERTSRVVPELVAWCLDTAGEVFVRAGTGLRLDPDAVEEFVLGALGASTEVRVRRATADGSQHRYLVCHPDGGVICGVRDQHLSWAEQARLMEAPLRHAAPDAMHAMVRPGRPVIRVSYLWERPPPTPYAEARGRVPTRLWSLAHLQSDYVPDAYLQQVMTSSQLTKIDAAGGLPAERWLVEHLGNDRHLVTARDQTPWLALDPEPYQKGETYASRPAVPDPATLAQARADFAPALLTYQVHQQFPSPLTG